ncbi:hypothetical protein BEH94_00615 [Candidatus Altiarchaeales archaeon WOR_SM1_SCG]|nr:hypothetical protein BEH94_00615 [Candidatus Altiarchaeales archaeon WOR_SM1_SCG]
MNEVKGNIASDSEAYSGNTLFLVGKLRMRNNNLIDFLTPMRAGAGDDKLKELFIEAVGRREPYFCE